MPRINETTGAITLIMRSAAVSSTVNSTPTIGFLAAPEEGIIRRVKVKAKNNLTSFTFALAEEDIFTGGDIDSEEMIAAWKVNEPNYATKHDSVIFLLDETSDDLYFKLKDAISGKSRHLKKLYYFIQTDNASNSDVVIKVDIEAIE